MLFCKKCSLCQHYIDCCVVLHYIDCSVFLHYIDCCTVLHYIDCCVVLHFCRGCSVGQQFPDELELVTGLIGPEVGHCGKIQNIIFFSQNYMVQYSIFCINCRLCCFLDFQLVLVFVQLLVLALLSAPAPPLSTRLCTRMRELVA